MRVEFLRQKRILLGASLVLVTLLLYRPVLHHQFINGWDDNAYITENAHVTSGLTWANITWAFSAVEPFYWHPLTWISHMLDYRLFGLNSGAHHFMNAGIHALNALLLFLLLNRATSATWRSLFAAFLFAVHPLNVETVAWAAERKSLLSVFFSLITIAVYGWYVRERTWKRYVGVAVAFLLALMSKPTAVTLPIVLLLIDYWPLERFSNFEESGRWTRLMLEKVPLLLIAAGVSAVTILGEKVGGTVVPLSVLPIATRIENALISYIAYLGKMFWPARLSAFYPHPASLVGPSLPMDQVIASFIALAGITAAVVYLRRVRHLAFGWAFFVLTMVPMIGFIQVGFQGIQDHFTYVPCIGLFIAMAWTVGGIAENLPIRRVIPVLVSLVIVTGYAVTTTRYLPYWQNGVTLFGHARDVTERPNPWIEQLYAGALLSDGQVELAFQHYQASCALGPRNEFCHLKMADILFNKGQFQRAVMEYQFALMLTQKRDVALICLTKSGDAYLRLGDYGTARQFISEALRVDPQNTAAFSLQQELFARSGGN